MDNDNSGARPELPELYPATVYDLLNELLQLDAVRSMSYFRPRDIGVIRRAYLALYVERGYRQQKSFTRAIRLFDHDGFIDDSRRPHWIDVADWYDEGPIKGDLHVEDGDHGTFVIDRYWSEEPKLIVLLPPLLFHRRIGSARRHQAYKWYWSAADLSLGVNEHADAALKITIDRLAQSRGMERVAPS